MISILKVGQSRKTNWLPITCVVCDRCDRFFYLLKHFMKMDKYLGAGGGGLENRSHRSHGVTNPTSAFRPPKKKTCNTCKKELPVTRFNKNNDSPDGRLNKCKDCLKEVERVKKEKKEEYAKKYFTF